MRAFRVSAKVFCFIASVFSFASPASAQLREVNLFGGASFTNYAPEQVPPFPSSFNAAAAGVPVTYPSAGLGGLNASFEVKPLRLLGIVADFSGFSGTETAEVVCYQPTPHFPLTCGVERARMDLYTFLAGPQMSFRARRFAMFVHGLIGGGYVRAHDITPQVDPYQFSYRPGEGAFAGALGGGVDYQFIPRVALRVQADA
jgi:hypothetical protein